MTLNASGPISIGGCTTGQSIAKELGLPTTATHSLNCTSYRNLSGQTSGAVSMNAFHGKSSASYMCVSTSGACVAVCGNYKIARFYGSGSFTVNRLGSGVGNYGNRIQYMVGGGGGGSQSGNSASGGGGGGAMIYCTNALCSTGQTVSQTSYTITVGGGGGANSNGTFSRIACGSNIVYLSAPPGASAYGCGHGGNAGSSTLGGTAYFCYGCCCGGAGGGGGAGANVGGGNAYHSGVYVYAGSGGTGLIASGNGFPYYQMGCGGGAGVFTYGRGATGTPGTGGNGYGGQGGYALNCSATYISNTSGAAYRGGGGGGGNSINRSGGSGFVIIRWRFQ